MAANPEELEERVAYLERELERKGVIIDHLQAQSNRHLGAINQQMSTLTELVKTGFEANQTHFTDLGRQINLQNKQYADLNANVTDIRNKVADLVNREGK